MGRERVILAIETSNPSAWEAGDGTRPGVALGRWSGDGVEILGVDEIDPARPHDDDLMPAIDRLAKRCGIRPRDLTHVAVSAGPGGYTAVRIGVTTAKMIAEATGAAAMAVPSALVAARRVAGAAKFGVAISSKGESTCLACFEAVPGSEAVRAVAVDGGERTIVTASTIVDVMRKAGAELLVSDRFLPEAIRDEVCSAGSGVRRPWFDPVACLEAAPWIGPVDPAELEPIYAREPEAVTKWRALKKKDVSEGDGRTRERGE